MPTQQPTVFNIQKFCVHDGPGIRTTLFFKGCPLHCLWCHNPEGISFSPELLVDTERCTGCGRCMPRCPQQAISRNSAGAIELNRDKCSACGQCLDACLADLRQISGSPATIDELIREIVKDQVFYEQSGGGVTFSGGEALCQVDVVEKLARACKEKGIHTAADTCGHLPFATFEQVLDCIDLFLYDIKHMNSEQHRKYTGQGNELILENLRRLSDAGANIFLRLPLIEGVNSDDGNMQAIADYIKDLRIIQVNLLPYHNTGSSKFGRMGVTAPAGLQAPSAERLEEIRALFAKQGLRVYLGG